MTMADTSATVERFEAEQLAEAVAGLAMGHGGGMGMDLEEENTLGLDLDVDLGYEPAGEWCEHRQLASGLRVFFEYLGFI